MNIFPMSARQEAAWLEHLALLAELPYPGAALMPTVMAALKRGFQADMGIVVWVAGDPLKPVATWVDRTNGSVLSIQKTRMAEVFKDFPLDLQLQTDGDLIRQLQAMPGDEDHWVYKEALNPLGVHWGICAPLLDEQRQCQGFLYLYRAKEAGPFSDEDNQRLKRARDRLQGLGRAPSTQLPPCSHRLRHAAQFQFDMEGRMQARSAQGVELLYLYQGLGEGLLDWCSEGLDALPPQARSAVAQLLDQARQGSDVAPLHFSADLPAGRFDCHAELMLPLDDAQPQVLVRISHHEPLDVAVARSLQGVPWGLQEKRILVATTRQPSSQQLADHLGVTACTLKTYINRLQAKAGVSSRQALIERLLTQPVRP